MKTFWVVCQNMVDKCRIFYIFEASGLFQQILKIVSGKEIFQRTISLSASESHIAINITYLGE